MTEEQYNEALKYRHIIETFAKSGEYLGGIDPLMDKYSIADSERRCPSCVGRFLLDRNIELKKHEGNM